MLEDEEFEQRGFELLLKRKDYELFFDALAAAGLFDPARNLGPVKAEKEGTFWVPQWRALAYLEAVARLSGERQDTVLAEKIMGVVRNVSLWRDEKGEPHDNYRTWFTFAHIIGLVPTESVSIDDVELLPIWLSRLERTMVAHSLANGTLAKFIASSRKEDWQKACRILFHATAVEWVEDKLIEGEARPTPKPLIDAYWIKEIVNASAASLGAKIGAPLIELMDLRLREIFANKLGGQDTWLVRPAIEDHEQNHKWDLFENAFIEGMRDALMAWMDSAPNDATSCLRALLASQFEIIERIAIYVVNEKFGVAKELVPRILNVEFFGRGHLHEMYQLLRSHFAAFNSAEKTATVAAIRNIKLDGDAPELSSRRIRITQKRWLTAIINQGWDDADKWMLEIAQDSDIAGDIPHPDFNSYMTSHTGFGPTPYSVQEIVAWATASVLVEKLNSFQPSNDWNGPSLRSLSDAVVEAVAVAPNVFLNDLEKYKSVKPQFQYSLIEGFKRAWGAWDGSKNNFDWDIAWPKLIKFCGEILADENFWKVAVSEKEPLAPTRDWVPATIAEFLRAGMRDDKKAFAPELLPNALAIITVLLERVEEEKSPRENDALNRAINTSKGKIVEALIDFALRSARVGDEKTGAHLQQWNAVEALFDRELASCREGNYDFSALMGAYVVNFQYLNADWVRDNFGKIFPVQFPGNCLSALDGLAFSPANGPLYDLLITNGVIDWALRQKIEGRHAPENLIQRIALAYLWGKENFSSPRFQYFYNNDGIEELSRMTRYFWSFGIKLPTDARAKVVQYWAHTQSWAMQREPKPERLISMLSLLTCHIEMIGKQELDLLLGVAPYVGLEFNADKFFEELNRLVVSNPLEVEQVLRAVLEKYRPSYDFENKLLNLLTTLTSREDTKADALNSMNKVRYLPGVKELFETLTA